MTYTSFDLTFTKMFSFVFAIVILESSSITCTTNDGDIEMIDNSLTYESNQPLVESSSYIEELTKKETEKLVYGYMRAVSVMDDVKLNPIGDMATKYIYTEKMFQMFVRPKFAENVTNINYNFFRPTTLRKFVKAMNDATLDIMMGHVIHTSMKHFVSGSMDKDGNAKINFYGHPTNAFIIPEFTFVRLNAHFNEEPDIELINGLFAWSSGCYFDIGLNVPGHKSTLKLHEIRNNYLKLPFESDNPNAWIFDFSYL
eukprot:756066_1